jgi:hypothetical protein
MIIINFVASSSCRYLKKKMNKKKKDEDEDESVSFLRVIDVYELKV